MSPTPFIRCEIMGDVLVVWIENPPGNADALDMRQGILDAIERLEALPALQSAVLIGAGMSFIAGSDPDDLSLPRQAPQLSDVIAAMESCAKPVVVALQGEVLGGGFEFVLGCDARVAAPGTRVGLPEVSMGMIAGAGGIQRLARRAGLLRGLELVCGSERLSVQAAQELGLVDKIAVGPLLDAAIAWAQGMGTRKVRIRDEAVAPVEAQAFDSAVQQALRKGKHRPGVAAAVQAMQWCAMLPIDEALQREAALSRQLRLGRDAFALRYQINADLQTGMLPPECAVGQRKVEHVAVIGAGTMGTGIAIAALDAGLKVLLLEQDPTALERGLSRVTQFYADRVAAGKLAQDQAQTRQSALRGTLQWSDLSAMDLVIEAVFEDLAVKQDVFRKIDQYARAGAVLATNTSYLDVDAIAAVTRRSADVLGLHFFSPANVMKLLEVVRGKETAADVIATGMAVGKRLNKLPVLCGNAFGFIGNRLYNAYRKQAEFMLEDGALPQEIDAALQQFGFAMGPFAVADLSGLDIAWRMRQSQAATRDPKERYVSILDKLCEAGRMGRKTGAGYYAYADGMKSSAVDVMVTDAIVQASAARGLERRQIPEAEILRRSLGAMCNEAALLLAEGVARQPSDIDVVMVQGYGFPRWEGGPLFWIRQFDAKEQQALQDELAIHSGHGFVRGDLQLLGG